MDEEKNGIVSELERVYSILNEKLFGNKLKPVKIVVARSQDYPKRKVALRYFSETATLVVGSEFPKLEYADLPTAMLHEMIHIYNHQNGTIDCTTNQYHNKAFLSAALAAGLVVIKHKTQGWSITTTIYPRNVVAKDYISKPQKDATARREDAFACLKIDKAILKEAKADIRQKAKEEKPSKTFFLKYVCNCPPPHNSIRSGRRPDGPNALNIQCQNCHSTFVCATKLDDEPGEN